MSKAPNDRMTTQEAAKFVKDEIVKVIMNRAKSPQGLTYMRTIAEGARNPTISVDATIEDIENFVKWLTR